MRQIVDALFPEHLIRERHLTTVIEIMLTSQDKWDAVAEFVELLPRRRKAEVKESRTAQLNLH